MKRLLLLAPLLLLSTQLGGCAASQPVRHLASDAALIRPHVTTLSEAYQYLGEPQTVRETAQGVKEYVYTEDLVGFWGKAPLVGGMVKPSGYEMLVLTVKDDVVQSVVFRNFNEKSRDWVQEPARE